MRDQQPTQCTCRAVIVAKDRLGYFDCPQHGLDAQVRDARTGPNLDLLRRLWSFSQHGQMPIWIAGQLQGLVVEKLGMGEDVDVDEALGREIVELTRGDVTEIREREQRIVDGEEQV